MQWVFLKYVNSVYSIPCTSLSRPTSSLNRVMKQLKVSWQLQVTPRLPWLHFTMPTHCWGACTSLHLGTGTWQMTCACVWKLHFVTVKLFKCCASSGHFSEEKQDRTDRDWMFFYSSQRLIFVPHITMSIYQNRTKGNQNLSSSTSASKQK